MSAGAETVIFFGLAGCAFLLIGTLLSTTVVAVVRERVAAWEPRSRQRILMLIAASPVGIAAALLGAACLPSLLALFVPALDHCATHDDAHAHLCFVHQSRLHTPLPLVLLLVFVASHALVRAVFAWFAMQRSRQTLRALSATGTPDVALGATVIDTAAPICFAVGFVRGTVLVSQGLLRSLDPRARDIVLHHERAHIERKDALMGLLVRSLSALHLPHARRWILREHAIAVEQVCDEKAADAVGDRLAVADAILTVERAMQPWASSEFGLGALAFGESAVERRVTAMLGEPAKARSLRGIGLGIAAALAVLLTFADGLHHVAESLLSAISQ